MKIGKVLGVEIVSGEYDEDGVDDWWNCKYLNLLMSVFFWKDRVDVGYEEDGFNGIC